MRRCQCLKRPKTTNELRNFDAAFTRAKRNAANLVNSYDDIMREDDTHRSWKKHRKTQWIS